MEGRLLARARARQERLRSDNRAEESRRRAEIYARLPEIRELDAAIRGLMAELTGRMLGRGGRSVEELERESLSLQEKRAALLRENGCPEDYLAPIYACPRCRDTGWADGKICDCLSRLYKQEQTRELAPLLGQGNQTFESFRLDYYSPVADGEGERSPRQQMERVLAICRDYADNFSDRSPNLLFTGAPGLGKTFLSACIARVVSERGYSVVYDSVANIFARFETRRFAPYGEESRLAGEDTQRYLACDLLIMDDLGTEFLSPFFQSVLYELINTRLAEGKQTIISTNLDKPEWRKRYTPQVVSRLEGEYTALAFYGQDIRKLKKQQR